MTFLVCTYKSGIFIQSQLNLCMDTHPCVRDILKLCQTILPIWFLIPPPYHARWIQRNIKKCYYFLMNFKVWSPGWIWLEQRWRKGKHLCLLKIMGKCVILLSFMLANKLQTNWSRRTSKDIKIAWSVHKLVNINIFNFLLLSFTKLKNQGDW